MGRPAKPWYDANRRCWRATIDGVRHTLAEGPERASKGAADRRFHALMAARAPGRPRRGAPPTLAALMAAFVLDARARAARGELAARTADDYGERAEAFVRAFGRRRADSLTASDWDDFLAGRSWGPNRRAGCVGAVRTAYRWAKSRGLVDCPAPMPSRAQGRKLRRDKIPTPAEMEAILGAIESPGFRDFATFIRWSGCRPSEAARAEAKHVRGGAVELAEHKTRRKTGAMRVIPLNARTRPIVERLMAEHPEGPLFRTPRGLAWNRDTWHLAFRKARDAAGVDPQITLYTFRHGRATELLLGGVDLATAAGILGNDPSMTGRTYSDVVNQRDHLARAAELGAGERRAAKE